MSFSAFSKKIHDLRFDKNLQSGAIVGDPLDLLIRSALQEDMPAGDLTTDSLNLKIPGSAQLIAKQPLVLSGREVVEKVAASFSPPTASIAMVWKKKDGDRVEKSEVVAEMSGDLSALLKIERTALNFLGHLSGIATLTAQFVAETRGTTTKILDTRKTIPGYRAVEKKAVRDGGGMNHRENLSSQVLIKENHIRAAGSITLAVTKIREVLSQKPSLLATLEVEVTNMEELREALDCKVPRVLLDNMTNNELEKAMQMISGRCLTEASGNMNLERIHSISKLGVDFISVGLLTHSAPAADFSLLFNF